MHAIASDNRQDFDAWPGDLAFTSPDVNIFSESMHGGEYLALRVARHAAGTAPWAAPRAVVHGDRRAVELGLRLRRLMLAPPEDGSESAADDPEQTDLRYAALLGAIGVAATPLRPAGTVRLGDQYVDVVAEGSYVEAGSRIQVVEVEAHRIVVKEI